MLRGLYGPLLSIKSRELLSHYVFEAMQDELCVDVRSLHLLPAETIVERTRSWPDPCVLCHLIIEAITIERNNRILEEAKSYATARIK
jgi:hypothetical protein